jgi:hypothetical protein
LTLLLKYGIPYPWTETGLIAAKKLTDKLDNITPEEQEMLKKFNSYFQILRSDQGRQRLLKIFLLKFI